MKTIFNSIIAKFKQTSVETIQEKQKIKECPECKSDEIKKVPESRFNFRYVCQSCGLIVQVDKITGNISTSRVHG